MDSTKSSSVSTKNPVHLEIRLRPSTHASSFSASALREAVTAWLPAAGIDVFAPSTVLWPSTSSSSIPEPHPSIDRIVVYTSSPTPFWRASLSLHPYALSDEDAPAEEVLDDADADAPPALDQWTLPNGPFEPLWDALKFGGGSSSPASRLLAYALTILSFSGRGVASSICPANRLALLYGPPGTGKTTLCRALAQKLAVRTRSVFPGGAYLLEIRAHSLFSKWFSESGKTVSRLFDHVAELVEDEDDALVVLLIDEVESLAAARAGAISGNEPSDAVRAVNALLTQIDRMRNRPNVLVLATSNVTAAIDAAFLDRADVKVYVGPPCAEARRAMMREMMGEMRRTGVVVGGGGKEEEEDDDGLSAWDRATEGLSGRTVRKLPLRAAMRLSTGRADERFDRDAFLRAMCDAAKEERDGLRAVDMK